jgi:hypothetical protein
LPQPEKTEATHQITPTNNKATTKQQQVFFVIGHAILIGVCFVIMVGIPTNITGDKRQFRALFTHKDGGVSLSLGNSQMMTRERGVAGGPGDIRVANPQKARTA